VQQGGDLARLAGIVGGGDEARAGFELQGHVASLQQFNALQKFNIDNR
jgi:hypothetical protein